jgi:hypothetical protein
MRYFLVFWLFPVGFIASWYGLSANDISLGTYFFSREMHDTVFQIYGDILGMDPQSIPPLVLKAIVLDTFIILGLIALRNYKKCIAFFQAWRERMVLRRRINAIAASGPVPPAE